MNIYLLLHGLAVERGSAKYRDDRDRSLTAKGRTKIKHIARAMAGLKHRGTAQNPGDINDTSAIMHQPQSGDEPHGSADEVNRFERGAYYSSNPSVWNNNE